MELKRIDLYLKRCFVPNCKNNSSNTNKSFVKLPEDPELRKAWYEKVKTFKYTMSREYCCDAHFDLKHDIDNYDDVYTFFRTKSLVLKKSILPHLNLKTDMNVDYVKKKQSKCVDNCENHERHIKNNMSITFYNEYMNFDEYFGENEEVLAEDEQFTTDILYSSDISYSDQSLNLKSISEIDMDTSKLYFRCKYNKNYC